jgi:hypothetical protein
MRFFTVESNVWFPLTLRPLAGSWVYKPATLTQRRFVARVWVATKTPRPARFRAAHKRRTAAGPRKARRERRALGEAVAPTPRG